ncbi:DUF6480 family protein [Amycolatopsis marina]|nr:DUF6480 family protein [Amycolatopsis marina]
MTAQPPDPDPKDTAGLEPGGGVRPGDTPPDSAQVSGVSHQEPQRSKAGPIIGISAAVLVILIGVGFFVAYLLNLLGN